MYIFPSGFPILGAKRRTLRKEIAISVGLTTQFDIEHPIGFRVSHQTHFCRFPGIPPNTQVTPNALPSVSVHHTKNPGDALENGDVGGLVGRDRGLHIHDDNNDNI